MEVIINPGSGPVEQANEAQAIANMPHLVTDTKETESRFVRVPWLDYGDGRYAFLVWRDNECHEVQMPGLPLERVRYMGNDGQNIFDYPRLYVDGSSWVWKYAINMFEKDDE